MQRAVAQSQRTYASVHRDGATLNELCNIVAQLTDPAEMRSFFAGYTHWLIESRTDGINDNRPDMCARIAYYNLAICFTEVDPQRQRQWRAITEGVT